MCVASFCVGGARTSIRVVLQPTPRHSPPLTGQKEFASKCRYRQYKNKHGFVVRGDLSDPDVKVEIDDALALVLEFAAGVFA